MRLDKALEHLDDKVSADILVKPKDVAAKSALRTNIGRGNWEKDPSGTRRSGR